MKLNYRFSEQSLLEQALTHRSANTRSSNERLEFLGDAIINNLVAEAVYKQFPVADEGQLSRLRARLVKQESLARIARTLELGDGLVLGPGEMKSGGHRRESILADALEALVAAIYLDSDLPTCKQVVLAWFADGLAALSLQEEHRDYKTRLQEWLQARKRPLPVYELVAETGADNDRHFVVNCRVDRCAQEFCGNGASKKQAEQLAAEQALAFLDPDGVRA